MLRTWVANWLNKKSRPIPSSHITGRRQYRLRLECLEDRTVPAIISVTGIGDTIAVDGLVTLREALASANANSNINADVVGVGAYGTDTINFNIAGSGVKTISPTFNLPTITDDVIIDGYSQPGSSANTLAVGNDSVHLIEINGTAAPAGSAGFAIGETGGGSTIRGLVINRFATGLQIRSGANVVEGCFFNMNPAGDTAVLMPNGLLLGGGIQVVQGDGNRIGGTVPASRNVIVADSECIRIGNPFKPTNTLVQGNYVGTNAQGTASLNDKGYIGISVNDSSNTVIGGLTDTPGTGAGNVVSGNGTKINGITGNGDGIRVTLFGTTALDTVTIQGNLVGTNATGTAAIPNPRYGVVVVATRANVLIGGPQAGSRNVISGNGTQSFADAGLVLETYFSPIAVQNNFIGTGIDGVTPIPNLGDGIFTASSASSPTTIGGISVGERNIIANNGKDGVFVFPQVNDFTGKATILGNSIFNNGGLGINLGLSVSGPALTLNDLNDGDGGVNGLQNYPVISSVSTVAGTTTIQGTLNSVPSGTYRIEFFSSVAVDPSTYGEGQTYLGFVTVTDTNGDGNESFSFSPTTAVPAGRFISATATDADGNTSEFSGGKVNGAVGLPDLQITINDGVASTTAGSTLTYTLNYSNTGTQAATGVQLTETLPAGTTFNAAASTAGWTQSAPGSGIYKLNVGNLPVGSGSAVFVVTVNNPVSQGQTQIVNTASIADDGANGTDPTPANNSATDTDTLTSLSTDLSVSNVVSSATTNAGGNLTFTLEVRNLGNNPASGVSLTDAIPSDTTFVSFTAPAGWTVQAPAVGGTGTVTVTRSSLAAGATGTFQLVVRVNAAAAIGAIIANTAQVSTTTSDSNTDNNTASATSQVVLQTSTQLTFTLTNRLADYRSELGLFIVDDAAGLIGTLRPGDRGYAQAALARRQFYFNRLARLGTSYTLDLPAGKFYGWYLVQNSSSAQFLRTNPNNKLGSNPIMFFSFKAANPDATEHTKQLAANLIGFEDLTRGGDRDYNDLVVKVTTVTQSSLTAKVSAKLAKSK